MIKNMIKNIAFKSNALKAIYISLRAYYHRVKKLVVFIYDAKNTYRDMSWTSKNISPYWALSSELVFQYHKLEKGLCMPGEKRFFGYDPAAETIRLVKEWRSRAYDLNDPIYIGALETLRAYRVRLDITPPVNGANLLKSIEMELANTKINEEFTTPIINFNNIKESDYDDLNRIYLSRRSVRIFKNEAVDISIVNKAVSLAQLSPSACNRQPCRVHVFSDKEKKEAILQLQNGNRGFGDMAPTLLVLTSSASCFFDAHERSEPFFNGGIFSMSFILALETLGISSCCLNWSVGKEQDQKIHLLTNICQSERILMILAIGYAEKNIVVPLSPRRSLTTVVVEH